MLVPSPELVVSKALSVLDEVSANLSPVRALNAAADRANVDRFGLACAIVQCDIDRFGRIDLLRLPNDKSVRDAIRDDDPAARQAITAELRRRPIPHAAAVFRCSSLWMQAAIYRWDIAGLHNDSKYPPLEAETRLDKLTPADLKNLLSRTFDHYKNVNEVAFALGVSTRWLIHAHKKIGGRHVKLKKAYVPRQRVEQALRLACPEEASPEEKSIVLRRMLELGNLSRWAQEANVSMFVARKQAKAVGYHAAKAATGQGGVRDTIIGWLESTEYPAEGYTTAWIRTNVTLEPVADYSAKLRIVKVMKELGYESVLVPGSIERRWLKASASATHKPVLVDDGQKLGPFDLSAEKLERRRTTRQQLLSGAVEPTEDLLKVAGLMLQ